MTNVKRNQEIEKYLNTETTSEKVEMKKEIESFFVSMKTGDKVTTSSLVSFLENECKIQIKATIKTDVVLEIANEICKNNAIVEKVKTDQNNKWSRIVYLKK